MSSPAWPTGHERCGNLLEAARLLLVRSGLLEWQAGGVSIRFPNEQDFEDWLTKEYRNGYGRYHAWMQLVVGGENLLKAWGFCTNNIPAGWPQPDSVYPLPPASGSGSAWISQVAQDLRTGGSLDNFGTLGRWLQMMPTGSSEIRKAGANYLKECRNREAHQYMTGIRKSRYPALSILLVPFFNELITELRANSHLTT